MKRVDGYEVTEGEVLKLLKTMLIVYVGEHHYQCECKLCKLCEHIRNIV